MRDTMIENNAISNSTANGIDVFDGGEDFVRDTLGGNLTTREVEVTPRLAASWLLRNKYNRRVRRHVVRRYAAAMASGKWDRTHQGIAFNTAGELVDGQHRLHAICESGATVSFLVTVNLDIRADAMLDQVEPRTAVDVLPLTTSEAAGLRAMLRIENGRTNGSVTVVELRDVVSRVVEFQHVARIMGDSWNGMRPSPQMIAAIAYAFPCDPDRIAQFARNVSTGEMLRATDPALKLRAWRFRRQGAIPARDMIFATLNAANYAMRGKGLTSIFTGPNGMIAITRRRRALNIPNTPSVEVVP